MDKILYYYKYHGFYVGSEIRLYELSEIEHPIKVDIHIRFGRVPLHLSGEKVVRKEKKEIAEDLFLLKPAPHLNVGRFLSKQGREIVFSPCTNFDSESVRHFLLGHVFNACLLQRKLLPLHASSIIKNGWGIAFTGPSGIGKSTTATYFSLKGCQLLSDDTSVISLRDGQPHITPSYSRVKLWEDVLDYLEGLENYDKHWIKGYSLDKPMNKYGIRLDNEYFSERTPLKVVYYLTSIKDQKGEFEIYDLGLLKKVEILRNQTSKLGFLNGMNLSNEHFQECTKIASQTIIKEIRRYDDTEMRISEYIDFIERDINSLIL